MRRATGLPSALVATLLALAGVPVARAEVARIDVRTRGPVLDGRSFGAVGPYEKITGRIVFSLDPALPANAGLADLDKAPRTPAGRVESTSAFVAIRPVDPARGNGIALLDVVNRGNAQLLPAFSFARGSADPAVDADFGDAFLLRAGFTLVALGWEPAPTGPIDHDAPVATDGGRPITGSVSNWFVPGPGATSFDLTSAYWTGLRPYPPLDVRDPEAELTVRDSFFTSPRPVPRDRWRFGRLVEGTFVEDPRHVTVEGGLDAGRVYEIRYRTGNPRVPTGLAAVRDLASHMRHGPDGPLKARHVVAYGASQTGRFLRAFLHEGFTTDEQGRPALDALWIHIGGASLGSFSRRFVQASEGGFFTTSWFPFLYASTRDPATGRVDGLGARVPEGAHPKVFIVDSSSEYWDRGRAAALNHVTIDGRADLPLAANVRVYHIAGTQHSPGTFPAAVDPGRQLPGNVIDQRTVMRALLVSLEGWLRRGDPPPPSAHATLSAGTLVPARDLRFPAIAGVRWPYVVPGAFRGDLPPPLTNHPLPFLVPAVDEDGNERGGIRLPEIAVPLATHTGWAFRSAQAGSPEQLMPLMGSSLAFSLTRGAREASGDPRRSVQERYPSRDDYLRQFEAAARDLVRQRLLLEEDVPRVLERGAAHWDALTGTAGTPR